MKKIGLPNRPLKITDINKDRKAKCYREVISKGNPL